MKRETERGADDARRGGAQSKTREIAKSEMRARCTLYHDHP